MLNKLKVVKKNTAVIPDQDLTIEISRLLVKMMLLGGRSKDEVMHLLAQSFHESDTVIAKVMNAEACEATLKKMVKQVERKYSIEQRTNALGQLWEIGSESGDISFLEEKFIDRLSFLIGLPEPHLNLNSIH